MPLGGLQVALLGRVGVHSGAVVAAIVGHTAPRLLAFGPDVAAAQRLEASGPPGRVHVSRATAARLSAEVMAAAGGGLEGPLQIEWPAAGAAMESFLLPAGAFESSEAKSAFQGDGLAHVAGDDKAAFEEIAHEASEEGKVVTDERSASTAEDAAAETEEAAAGARDEMHGAVSGSAGPHMLFLAAVGSAAIVQGVAAFVERLRWLHLVASAEAAEDIDQCTSAAAKVDNSFCR